MGEVTSHIVCPDCGGIKLDQVQQLYTTVRLHTDMDSRDNVPMISIEDLQQVSTTPIPPAQVFTYLLENRRILKVDIIDRELKSVLLEDGTSLTLINGKFLNISYNKGK